MAHAELFGIVASKLTEKFLETCRQTPNKKGFVTALKQLFRTYNEKPFLYDINKPDYQSFITKLPPKAIEKMKFDSIEFFRTAIKIAGLRLKINEKEAYGVLGALISTIYAKETISVIYDYFSTVDFMVDSLISSIFE